MTTPFWFSEPSILLKQHDITQVWPTKKMAMESKLNAITRLVILLTILGYLLTQNIKMLVTGIATLAAIVVLYKVEQGKKGPKKLLGGKTISEGFTNPEVFELIKANYTQPTVTNPIMNVLLPEINDNPNRQAAAPAFNPNIEAALNEKTKQFITSNFDDPTSIDDRLFKDLGDSFVFDQSMRTWYATANTRVENDQKSFAEYCYGDMKSCKEGNEFACLQSAPPRWTNY